MTPGGQFDAGWVQALFRELSDRLAAAGVQAQMFVVGGAAMAWPTTQAGSPATWTHCSSPPPKYDRSPRR